MTDLLECDPNSLLLPRLTLHTNPQTDKDYQDLKEAVRLSFPEATELQRLRLLGRILHVSKSKSPQQERVAKDTTKLKSS